MVKDLKNAVICSALSPLLIFADMLCYIILKKFENSKIVWQQSVYLLVYIYIIVMLLTFLILLVKLGYSLYKTKWNKILFLKATYPNFVFVILIIINLGELYYCDKICEQFIVSSWLFIDIAIAWIIANNLDSVKSTFITKEEKTTYNFGYLTIENTKKNYPILLPIITAIITAAGAIIASMLKYPIKF